ncbi:hypothetical protein QE152_g7372 [Popillia japonica]|uniref:Uncharacterized protein n=1 Tax=Popillia japonica TaxID=7064 RepID=A0AAW1MF03_POPJA
MVNLESKTKSDNYCVSQCLTRQSMSHTNLNKTLNCKEAMQKLSELLGDSNVNDCNNNLHESLEELEKLANERNFFDILNQKYPTFIGFQLNENQKIKHSVSKKASDSQIYNNKTYKEVANSKNSTTNIWHLKNDYSDSSLSNEIELFDDIARNSVYSEELKSQTVMPLCHKIQIQGTSKKNRSEDRIKFNVINNETTKLPDKESKLWKAEDSSTRKSSLKHKIIKRREQPPAELKIQNMNNHKGSPASEKGFYAQIIQKTSSTEHPLITTKLSQSSSKSSLNSFILICLKHADSNSRLQNTTMQSDNYLPTNNASLKKRKQVDAMTIPAEPEKIDKNNMFSQEMDTVGVQVFIAKHVLLALIAVNSMRSTILPNQTR